MYKDLEENRGMSVSHISSLSMYHAMSIHQPVWVFSLVYCWSSHFYISNISSPWYAALGMIGKQIGKGFTGWKIEAFNQGQGFGEMMHSANSFPSSLRSAVFLAMLGQAFCVVYKHILYLFWPSKGSLKVRSWRFMSTNAQKDTLSDKSENFGRLLSCSLWRNDMNLSKVRNCTVQDRSKSMGNHHFLWNLGEKTATNIAASKFFNKFWEKIWRFQWRKGPFLVPGHDPMAPCACSQLGRRGFMEPTGGGGSWGWLSYYCWWKKPGEPPGIYKTLYIYIYIYIQWDKLPISWCRISAINSITVGIMVGNPTIP